MRATMLLESDPAAAARCATDILAHSPGHAETMLLLAAACQRLGDPGAAINVLEPLAAAQSHSPVLKLELGRAYAAAARGPEATAAFQEAVDLDALLADAWRELAAQRFLVDDIAGGDEAYLRYSRLAAEPPELIDAHVAATANRVDAAEAMARNHLQRSPRDVAALRLLADLAARRGERLGAEHCLIRCLEIAPGDSVARYELARLLYRQERVAEVMPLVERLIATEPRHTGYLSLKAQAMRLVGRIQESIALMQQVVADFPDEPQAWLIYGNLMREAGDASRAIDAFWRALAVQPGFGEAYWALANLKTYRFSAQDIERMRAQLAQSAARGVSRVHLEFALGKALEDEAQYATSFEHYARGAALQRATLPYDAEATTEFTRRSISLYQPAFFAARAGWGSRRVDPIFIVGLPRSGSTLLEQMLACHPQIEGTRELPDLPAIVIELYANSNSGRIEYPESVGALPQTDIENLAVRYLSGTDMRRPLGRARFVDKMLGNFSHIGLIHLMFPQAVIIDARRHPLACGFSCYKQLFAQGMNFSYDLGEMGRYYRDYAALMSHFDSALPGRVYRVQYEQLIADPEAEIRRLLEHCRLPFDAACLRFYENPRPVQTISSEQVRRPLYADAVEQWRRYEPWLDPLKAALQS